MKSLIALILFMANSVSAEEFSKEETILEYTYYSLALIDYGQTLNISRNPDKWEEVNPMLDEHPTESEVHRHFILTSLLHWGISELLTGTEFMKYHQWSSIAVNLYVTHNNAQIGISMSF